MLFGRSKAMGGWFYSGAKSGTPQDIPSAFWESSLEIERLQIKRFLGKNSVEIGTLQGR